MANELRHKGVGPELEEIEFEDVTLHQLDSQAIGDLIKAISDTQLSRLPVGSNDQVLTVVSGVPAWAAPPPSTLAEDALNEQVEDDTAQSFQIPATSSYEIATCTTSFDANSMAVGFGALYVGGTNANNAGNYLRLFMGAVQVAQSAAFVYAADCQRVVKGTKALSGSQIVYCTVYNTRGYAVTWNRYSQFAGSPKNGCVAVGSIKLI